MQKLEEREKETLNSSQKSKRDISEQQLQIGKICVDIYFVILILLTIFVFPKLAVWFGNMDISDERYVSSEKAAWKTQLHKDPSTWTSEERKRYEDFIEWDSKYTQEQKDAGW